MQSSYVYQCTWHAQLSWITHILPSFKKLVIRSHPKPIKNKTPWTNEQRCYEMAVVGTCPPHSFMCSASTGLRNARCMHRSPHKKLY